jgi:hypothetical protein
MNTNLFLDLMLRSFSGALAVICVYSCSFVAKFLSVFLSSRYNLMILSSKSLRPRVALRVSTTSLACSVSQV